MLRDKTLTPTLRVRALSDAIRRQPEGVVTVPLDELAELTDERTSGGTGKSGDDPLRDAQALLRHQGIRATPPLRLAGAPDNIALRRTSAYALQGALVFGLLAAAAFAALYWAYGAAIAVATAAAAAALRFRFGWFDRALPRVVPRGRLLGATVATGALLVAGVIAVLPLWLDRRERLTRADASALVQQAAADIAAGRLDEAGQKLQWAEALTPDAEAIESVRAEYVYRRVGSLLDEQNRKAGIFNEAERAFQEGRHRRAIRLMSSIAGFRNADARLREYRLAQRRRERRSARG